MGAIKALIQCWYYCCRGQILVHTVCVRHTLSAHIQNRYAYNIHIGRANSCEEIEPRRTQYSGMRISNNWTIFGHYGEMISMYMHSIFAHLNMIFNWSCCPVDSNQLLIIYPRNVIGEIVMSISTYTVGTQAS